MKRHKKKPGIVHFVNVGIFNKFDTHCVNTAISFHKRFQPRKSEVDFIRSRIASVRFSFRRKRQIPESRNLRQNHEEGHRGRRGLRRPRDGARDESFGGKFKVGQED